MCARNHIGQLYTASQCLQAGLTPKEIRAAEAMAGMTVATGQAVQCKFNDIVVLASPCEPPEEIVKRYHAESERRHAEYVASPEYKRQQEEAERKD